MKSDPKKAATKKRRASGRRIWGAVEELLTLQIARYEGLLLDLYERGLAGGDEA